MTRQQCSRCPNPAVVVESEYAVVWLCGPCWSTYLHHHHPEDSAFGRLIPVSDLASANRRIRLAVADIADGGEAA